MQINLLPELVLKRRQEKQIKRWATTGLVAWGGFLVLLVVLSFSYKVYQDFRLKQASSKFETLNSEVNSADNLAFRKEALEVQASLKSLKGLYSNQRRMSVSLTMIADVTPKSVRLAEINITSEGKVTISGVAGSYEEAGRMVLAMRQTKPEKTSSGSDQAKDDEPYFDGVVLGGANKAEAGVAFTVTAQYVDPAALGSTGAQL